MINKFIISLNYKIEIIKQKNKINFLILFDR